MLKCEEVAYGWRVGARWLGETKMQVKKEMQPVRAIWCPGSRVSRSRWQPRQSTSVYGVSRHGRGGAAEKSRQVGSSQGEGVWKVTSQRETLCRPPSLCHCRDKLIKYFQWERPNWEVVSEVRSDRVGVRSPRCTGRILALSYLYFKGCVVFILHPSQSISFFQGVQLSCHCVHSRSYIVLCC